MPKKPARESLLDVLSDLSPQESPLLSRLAEGIAPQQTARSLDAQRYAYNASSQVNFRKYKNLSRTIGTFGATGLRGATGASGASGTVRVFESNFSSWPPEEPIIDKSCPELKRLLKDKYGK